MKLTRRQEDFVRKLIDLYREVQGPIHYSVLAKRLGVNRFTAYDMLRLLEEKGLATSQYKLAVDKSGPGRSRVVFMPTPQAHRRMAGLTEGLVLEDWEAVKDRVLARIQDGDGQSRELAREMLARISPEGEGPLRYCLEIMTVVALRLRHRAGRKLLTEFLPKILPSLDASSRSNLSLLGGFAFGVLADENLEESEWDHELTEHVKRYHSLVIEMEPKIRRQLAAGLIEVFAPLSEL